MTDKQSAPQESPRAFPRRHMLRGGTVLTGAALAGVGSPFAMGASAAGSGKLARLLERLNLQTPVSVDDYTPVALTLAELTTLNAAIDRIIPSDDLGPGAVETGVFIFIDQELAGASAPLLPLFQGGLAVLDAAAGSGGFAALDTANQDAILTQAEAGELTDLPQGFFPLLVYNTRSGMFSDPIYGGNKDFAGWDLMQFPGIKLVWTEADQQIDAVVKPEHLSVAQFRGDEG